MLDGDGEGGVVSMKASVLLDEVCELVALWFVEAPGAQDDVEAYFTS